jgi:hypothetical protein
MFFFFAGISAAKKNEGCSLRPLRLCGEKILFKRENNYELEN